MRQQWHSPTELSPCLWPFQLTWRSYSQLYSPYCSALFSSASVSMRQQWHSPTEQSPCLWPFQLTLRSYSLLYSPYCSALPSSASVSMRQQWHFPTEQSPYLWHQLKPHIPCTISLAPPTIINHKLCEVNYQFLHLLHMLKTCILATKICKIFLASRIVLRVRQLNSKGVDKWKSHFWYRHLWSFFVMVYSSLPVLIGMELMFNFL